MNIVKVHMTLPDKGASKSAHINLDNACAIQKLSISTQIVFVGGWTILVDETPEEIVKKANS
ncbi:hypothetical protein [Acetobacter oryzifermentans]|uniref:Uncharacterized protein n=1 Tax=Acetobacter oryzifermentans TaxID=1633874 RepID=A0ABM6AHF5_9PROT|nr:hypothetical protein [Acetobacter oryzifermentans]ANA13106.1 hypothetical protein WG31_03030 [Acetobacter oryzifermentans]